MLTTKCLKINEISIIVSCTLCSVLWLRKIWKSEANVELPWPCVLFKGQQGETHSKRVKTTLLLNSIYQHINSFLMSLWSLSLLSDHLHHSIHMIPYLQVNSKTIKQFIRLYENPGGRLQGNFFYPFRSPSLSVTIFFHVVKPCYVVTSALVEISLVMLGMVENDPKIFLSDGVLIKSLKLVN